MIKIKEIKPKIGFLGVEKQDIVSDLNFAAENGFEYYEIGWKKDFDLEPEIIKEAKRISKKYNISFNFHIPYFLQISSYIPGISKAAVKFTKKEIILAKKLGVKIITIHSGYKEAVVAENFKVLIKNLREIVRFGKKYKIKIGLEHSPTGGGLCINEEEILKVVNSVKGLKIVFDVGHANTTESGPLKYFKKVKEHVINIHIHDNNGSGDRHLLIGKGNINFKKFLKECKKSNYCGPFIFEIFPNKNINFLKARQKFLNIWNQI